MKKRRPGNGPIPRGSEQARREAAHARRVAVEVNGTPVERSALHLPYSGSGDYLERFWARVTESDGCWLWNGHRDTRPAQGYGIADRGYRAHRLAWELANGVEVPAGLVVCHSCDNPRCCRPSHLFSGTTRDNIADCRAKGRHHNASRTHCRRGHPLIEGNLVPDKRPGVRKCRTCAQRLARKNYYLRQGKPEKAEAYA